MKIIIVRHTESEGNVLGVYGGVNNYKLTSQGIRQMEYVLKIIHERYNLNQYTKVYTSPLSRCLELSNKIKDKYKCQSKIHEGLIEFNFGIFEGKTYDYIKENYSEQCNQWFKDFINYKIPQGESIIACYKRVEDFTNYITKDNEDTIVITHGGIMKLIVIQLLNLSIEDYWKFYFGNGAILEVEYKDNFGYIRNLINNN